ncbi:MAG: hypothetical protein ACRDX8_14255, partial [Acidimicrobiales bacterium]
MPPDEPPTDAVEPRSRDRPGWARLKESQSAAQGPDYMNFLFLITAGPRSEAAVTVLALARA